MEGHADYSENANHQVGRLLASEECVQAERAEDEDIEFDTGEDIKAHGTIVDHEYEIERDGDTVATVSKKWFGVRDSYGAQMAEGQDVPLILAITVCVDAMARG